MAERKIVLFFRQRIVLLFDATYVLTKKKKTLISFNKENVNFLHRDKNAEFFSAVEIEIHREISCWEEELIHMVEMS